MHLEKLVSGDEGRDWEAWITVSGVSDRKTKKTGCEAATHLTVD
jgi:hypothetical protein